MSSFPQYPCGSALQNSLFFSSNDSKTINILLALMGVEIESLLPFEALYILALYDTPLLPSTFQTPHSNQNHQLTHQTLKKLPIQPPPFPRRHHNRHPSQNPHRLPLPRLQPLSLPPPPRHPPPPRQQLPPRRIRPKTKRPQQPPLRRRLHRVLGHPALRGHLHGPCG